MPQNYEVMVASFRPYVHGNVIPEYAAGPTAEARERRVKAGVLSPTNRPVNCPLVAPPAAPARDVTADVLADLDAARKRAEQAEEAARLWEGRAAEFGRKVSHLEAALAKQVQEIAHLTEACESHQAAREKAEAERAALEEQLTAPAAG